MDNQEEKVYVAITDDLQEGFETLKFVLEKWHSSSISIVIFKYVYTPYEKIEVSRKFEQEKFDKNLINFCGKVKAEILRIEIFDEQPICKIISELISDLRVTKFVMGIVRFDKDSLISARESKNVINELFNIQENKPEVCEIFIIERGKLVVLKDENSEAFTEDGNGCVIANFNKKKSSKNRVGKLFYDDSNEKSPCLLQSSSTSNDSTNQWEKNVDEIDNYFRLIVSSNSKEEHDHLTDMDLTQNLRGKEKIAAVKSKICEAREIVKLKKKEAKYNEEKRGKAEWVIMLCTQRIQEVKARIARDIAIRLSTTKELDTARGEILDIESEIEEEKRKLVPMIELQNELSIKLKSSSLAKTHVEALLSKAIGTRADMVQEIEKLRRQRDVVNRQVEFCRDKDAIGSAKRFSVGFSLREFNAEELRAATDDFSECLRLKSSGGEWSNVYRGMINHTCVAIKLCGSMTDKVPQEDFHAKVKVLGQIRHPNIVAILGLCTELKCIIFEYMHNGTLADALIPPTKNSYIRTHNLNLHTRIHIAADISTCLNFLHMSAHSGLNPSKILLDRNNIAKICGFRAGLNNVKNDLKAFKNLLLQLLTLDSTATDWPVELATELDVIVRKCLCIKAGDENHEMSVASLNREIFQVRKKAGEMAASGGIVAVVGGGDAEELSIVPSVFLCPIFQDVMKDPHVAEDGYSYELDAITEWLGTGHDTSPMTNSKLKHKNLIANHTLRLIIEDWHSKRSIPIG